jgi:hypothetical protein
MAYTIPIIAIPAGKCPAKLESTEREDVIEWAEKVYSIGLKNNINYLPSAIVFFAQQFFSIFTEDYKIVCNHINSAYNNNNEVKFDEMLVKINEEKKLAEKEKLERREKEEAKERKNKEKIQPKPIEKKVELVVEPQPKKKITIRRK